MLAAIIAAGIFAVCYKSCPEPNDLLARYRDGAEYDDLIILRPLD